ncbi:hypothetical protein IL306_001540 [Fusarium sp. DS 682]|nr:hypothetical protein IL306_001540 [Fusarium sp. DS 682]
MAAKFFTAALIAAVPALAKTDLAGCTSYDTVVSDANGMYASRIWYVPDTGELCDFLDCGGGRAPPKTTVPGCPGYVGTATYSPLFINPKTLGGAIPEETGESPSSTEEESATITAAPTSMAESESSESETQSDSEIETDSESETKSKDESASTTVTDKTITTLATHATSSASSGSDAGSASGSDSHSASHSDSSSETTAASTPASTVSTAGAVMPTAGAFIALAGAVMYAGML